MEAHPVLLDREGFLGYNGEEAAVHGSGGGGGGGLEGQVHGVEGMEAATAVGEEEA